LPHEPCLGHLLGRAGVRWIAVSRSYSRRASRRLEGQPPERYVQRMDARASSRDRTARHRTAQRARGLRAVVLWLPDVTDPAYQARLADECRRLAGLTAEETTMAAGFARLAGRAEGWR
jgi:hypothetical protein